MNVFGQTDAKYVRIDNPSLPFETYESISVNYTHSFLFESLAGPNEMAETTVMGFDPDAIMLQYMHRIIITYMPKKTEHITGPFSYIIFTPRNHQTMNSLVVVLVVSDVFKTIIKLIKRKN